VVKLHLPCAPGKLDEYPAERAALGTWRGTGAARLLGSDDELRLLIIERLRPGDDLSTLPERPATRIAAVIARRLQTAPSIAGLIPLETWLRSLLSAEDLPAERALARRLLDSSPPPVVLHGDLHPGNVLRSGVHWRAIDPKGLWGDPAFDAAMWLRNGCAGDRVAQALQRARIWADALDCTPERVIEQAIVQIAVSVCWAREDGEDASGEWAHLGVLRAARR